MDTRTALRGSFVSKQVVAIGLVIAAIVLGFTSAVGAHALQATGVGSAGNRAATFAAGPAWDDTNRHSGAQSVGGSAATPLAYRAPSQGRGGPKD